MMAGVNTDPTTASRAAFGGESLLKIFALAIGIPLLIWIVNLAIMQLHLHRYHNLVAVARYVVFIAEIAILCWCVGRYLKQQNILGLRAAINRDS